MMKALLVTLVALLYSAGKCHAIGDSLIVPVTGGLVQGKLTTKGTINFLGIPYASAQRFQVPSASVASWSGVRNASAPGPQCPQRCPPVIRDLYCLPESQMSETCLTLNIFRPLNSLPGGQLFSVMVFIHGGGFESGSGAAPLYNGDYLARLGGVLVVTINYRLGALGFLPILNDYDDVISNFGLRDQQMALNWVQQNIGKFDGDPNKVTLFGAEAGCQSVVLLLTSPVSDPLFKAAILHSCPFSIPFRNKNESRQIAHDFADALKCKDNDIDCFRRKSVDEILQAQDRITDKISSSSPSLRRFQVWGPAVDKRTVYDTNSVEEITDAFIRPTSPGTSKPVIIGMVSEEGRASVYRNYPLPVSASFFQRLVEAELPKKWQSVVENPGAPYRPTSGLDAREEMSRFLHDFVYTCPAKRVASSLANNGDRNVWMFSFEPQITLSPGGSAWPPGGETYCLDRACQGLDLMYLFNSPSAIPESRRPVTEGLSQTLVNLWANFAKYFNPNGPQGNSPESRTSVASPPPASFSSPRGSLSGRSTTTLDRLPPNLLRLMQTPSPGDRSNPAKPQFAFVTSPFLFPAALPASVAPPSSSNLALRQPRTLAINPNNLFSGVQSQIRQAFSSPNVASPPPVASSANDWPMTSTGDVTLALTQPSTAVRYSVLVGSCSFWERL